MWRALPVLLTACYAVVYGAVVYVSFGASFAAPETAIPAVAAALAGSLQQMRFVVSMKPAEQQLLKVCPPVLHLHHTVCHAARTYRVYANCISCV